METYANSYLKNALNKAKEEILDTSQITKYILDTITRTIVYDNRDRYVKYLIATGQTETITVNDNELTKNFGPEYLTTEFVGCKITKTPSNSDYMPGASDYSIKFEQEVLIEGTDIIVYIPLLEVCTVHDGSRIFTIHFNFKEVNKND